MTHVVKIKSGSKFKDMASYSRLVAVNDPIFVSNTAGRNPDTREIPEDITVLTLQVFANIERALAADIHRRRAPWHPWSNPSRHRPMFRRKPPW